MKKIRAAVVGYGNIGHYTLQALEAAPDFEVAGIVRRKGAENCPEELKKYDVVKDIRELKDVDVAVLATPTRSVEAYAKDILSLGINTVDSFDIHTQIVDLRRSLDAVAKEHGAVSIISAGWDPGSDSVVRTLLQAIAPKGITYTNFGPAPTITTRRRPPASVWFAAREPISVPSPATSAVPWIVVPTSPPCAVPRQAVST